MYVSMCGCVHVSVLKEARGMGASGAGAAWHEFWELNSGPLEDQ